jgi:uncharacterized protein YjiS (DUF1127 family)
MSASLHATKATLTPRNAITRAWTRLRDAWRRLHAEHDLQALDDPLLRDIGVPRAVIPYLGLLGRQAGTYRSRRPA